MKKVFKYTLLFFGLFFALSLFSQQSKDSAPEIEWRIPDKELIEQYKSDSAFDYYTPPPRQMPLWMQKIMGKLVDFFGTSVEFIFSREFGLMLLIIFIATLIVMIYLRSQNMNLKTLFGRQKLRSDTAEFLTEDVNSMDFDDLIDKSLLAGDYRLAVRFLYLKTLKILSDSNHIRWQPGKTNYGYVSEIDNESIRDNFMTATRIFDFVWYGEMILDEPKFNEARNFFQQFNRMISNER